jgi:hypothetical protein
MGRESRWVDRKRSAALVCWPLPGGLLDLIVEEVLGDGRVSAGGGV